MKIRCKCLINYTLKTEQREVEDKREKLRIVKDQTWFRKKLWSSPRPISIA